MLIFDWHLDLAWNALEWNRDLKLPVADIRRREIDRGYTGPGRGTNTVSLPALRHGSFAVVSATLLARHDRDWRPLGFIPKSGYDSAEAANAMGLAQLAYYRALERTGQVRILTDWTALEGHVGEWQERVSTAPRSGEDVRSHAERGNEGEPPNHPTTQPPPLGFIISMEGADPILEPADVGEWWAAGLRIVSLSHYGDARYAHGTGTPGPLNEQGPALLRAMEEVGMILDVTHLADEAMDQAFDAFGGTVIASHHNCRALVDRQRQLRDSDIRKIVARGGVIGASCDAWMLDPDCGQGPGKVRRVATLESVADHIDHVCQVAGSAKHSAIGSDLDGGFGTEQSPADLDTIADLQKLPAILESRGYSGDDIAGIMHGNWLDLVRRSWQTG
jgi:membrane dipeptidase